jgi:phospholipid/cholesterol/gamma-HCH transport system substrate-binding protein
LRVGITVLFAAIVLGVLIFLISGDLGFGHQVVIRTYLDNANGLRVGAPVRLHGVGIGNVSGVRVDAARKATPVEVLMKVSATTGGLHKDSTAMLSTAGVLGEVFVDIDSSKASGPAVQNGDVLRTVDKPDIQDVVASTQSTLVNLQALLNRVDRILTFVESGNGSIGKLIYDDSLYKRLNTSVNEVQTLLEAITQGKGSIGKLVVSDELYQKANVAVDKLNTLVDQVNSGQGTLGKVVKDPSLYDNANRTMIEARQLLADVNAGKGALGKMSKDEAFAQKLDNTITKLNLLADKLNNGPGSAGRFINDPALYDNSDKLLVETRELIKAVREHPKKYLTINLKLF